MNRAEAGPAAESRPQELESDSDLTARVADSLARWAPEARLVSMSAVGAGSSGRTFTVRLERDGPDKHVYVKAAPAGLQPIRNRDVVRQARLLRLLSERTSIPVPPVLHVEPGQPPAVPPFYVLAEVEGECWEPLTDESGRTPPPQQIRDRVFDATAHLTHLHSIPVELLASVGLERVELAAEVGMWVRALQRADAAELLDLGTSCAQALLDRIPDPLSPTLVHGDFRLGNQICAEATVRAILDWEISTISDPRIDLAWFLMTLSGQTLPSAVRDHVPGLPDADTVLHHYESTSGRPLAAMSWFAALAGLRGAAAMALNVKHNRRSAAPSARVERYSGLLPRYLQTARSLLQSS
ncbi:MAG TPA: phosphotransferase family protein [Jatrophihabitantaceae bacterium]|jgi:aminoglycoside phosphotransferase (APT) family kinase protein